MLTRVTGHSVCRLFTIAIYIVAYFYSPVQAETMDLDQATRAVLRKEVELQKLNTHFRIETTLVSPWRQRRMFAYGESNASLVESGIITVLPVRYNLARKKVPMPPVDNKNRTKIAAGVRLQLIGQCIGAGGDILELGLNFIHYCSLRKKGFNPSGYHKRVQIVSAELDKLLDERDVILRQSLQLSNNDLRAAQAEGKLLNDLRDLSLLEYQQYIAATKRFWAFQNTAYLVDFAKNATGAAGNIIGLAANHQRRIHWVGAAFLLSTISGAIVIVTPVVGRVTGNMSGMAAEKIASKELLHVHTNNAETYLSDKDQFLATVNEGTKDTPYISQAYKRKDLYNQQAELLLSKQAFLKRQRKAASGTLKENILFAGIVGPPRIANGTLGMIGGWHYYNNSPDRNRLFAAGNTAYLAGTTFNMFETARVQAAIELSNHRLAKTNLLPRQQFMHRLETLESMDQTLSK